jgi:hypothetical protein
VRWLRESFAAKLLAALLGTVGLLLVIVFFVVQRETARQVDVAVDRTLQSAATLFEELNELQREQAARLARPFTEGVRALQLLRQTIDDGDYDYLADVVEYEMQLAGSRTCCFRSPTPRGHPCSPWYTASGC